jgi:hypothetical protein
MKELDLKKSIKAYKEEQYAEVGFDKHHLDEEYEEQPRKFMDWAILYGQSLTLRKRAEAKIDRVKGQVDLDVRKNPAKYNLVPDDKGKVMESAIKSAVVNSEEVMAAEEDFYQVYELSNLFKHAMEAFIQRKELLKGEGELWINKYYPSPVVRESEARRHDVKDDVGNDLQAKMNRRRRLE